MLVVCLNRAIPTSKSKYVEQAEKSKTRRHPGVQWNGNTDYWISQVLSRAAAVGDSVFASLVDSYTPDC